MSYTFFALFAGALLLHSGVANRSIQDVLAGIFAPTTTTSAGAGTTGFLTSLLPDITGSRSGAAGPVPRVGATGRGSWDGSKQLAVELARVSGLARGSEKRSTRGTASGGVSDHWTGCLKCYAIDLTGSKAAMQRGAQKIAAALGRPDWRGGSWLEVNVDGYRVQVGWNLPDHYDHVHVGVRKIGYTP